VEREVCERRVVAPGSKIKPVPFSPSHHSHIINLAQMKRYIKTDGGYAEMSDGSKVEISRRKKDDFVAMLGGGKRCSASAL